MCHTKTSESLKSIQYPPKCLDAIASLKTMFKINSVIHVFKISRLQSVREYCRVLQSITECYRVLQSVIECYRVLQSITEYYTVLHNVKEYHKVL